MKTTRLMAIVLSLLIAASQTAFAATASTSPVTVNATVDTQLTLALALKEETSSTPLTLVDATSMAHGTLVRSFDANGNANALRGKTFHVFLGANTSSRPYTITSTMNALTAGAVALPRAIGLFPASAKNGAGANVGTLVANQDAVGTNKLVYTSNATGSAATIELVYALSGGNADGSSPFTGWAPVPPDQAAGTYASTITYTITV